MTFFLPLQSLFFQLKNRVIIGGSIFFYSCFFMGICSAAGIQHTTINLQIVASFTGSATHTGNTALLINNIYRTTGANHTIELGSSTDVEYIVIGDLIDGTTGTIYPPNQPQFLIQLTPIDGQKEIYVTYTILSGISEDQLILSPIIYGLDTTPPPLTSSYSGPQPSIAESDPVSFSWNPVIDAGIGLNYYSIQLSHSPTFTTAMEFSTTGTSLVLGGGSLTPGQRYRRRSAVDLLGNSIYGYPIAFTIAGSPPHPSSNAGTISSIGTPGSILGVKQKPSPISDQCPGGDRSGNYFDGICSLTVQPPVLLNVPVSHQAPDTLSRREKAYDKLTKPQQLYTFPNYNPPKPYTIYEYESKTPTKIIPVFTNNLGIQTTRQGVNRALNSPTTPSSSLSKTPLSYLHIRYISKYPTCSSSYMYCSIEPVCSEIRYGCSEGNLQCNES